MKFILLPFSWVYGLITSLRNVLYDKGIFKAYTSSLKTIVIGNLQVGGSGKTPMTAYLYEMFLGQFQTAILSRGYGRSTKGLLEANADSNAEQIGDEPLWYYRHLKNAKVVVAEKRQLGLQYLEKSHTQLVLLDDAFQHRAVRADMYLMLSEYSKPYFKDYPMPYGRLREYRSGDRRADCIILTKCPDHLKLEDKVKTIQAINPMDGQEVFFTGLTASTPVDVKGKLSFNELNFDKVIALSGIASPDSFITFCQSFGKPVQVCSFRDHHHYTADDIKSVLKHAGPQTLVICTEKDAVKLGTETLISEFGETPLFSLPVRPYFLFDEEDKFKKVLKSKIK
ncbi:MAG: tetraacyldisaccharide 4'-kinase [Chitinophagaceae bacterium]